MSQNDFVIDNGTGLAVRQDIESAFQALASNNSGSSAPSTTYGLQSFANTTDSMLQLRNAANNAFVNLRKFDGSLPLPDGSNSSPSLFFDDDTNTGIFSAGGDQINVTTDGTARMGVDNSGNLNFAMEASSSYPIQKLKWSNDSSTTNGFYIAQHSDRNGRIWHEQGLDLVFGTNNAESARLDLSKRFFVGTTTTSLGSSGVFGEICLRGGTEGAGIHMADNDANVHAGFFTSDNSNFFVIRTVTDHPMIFRTNNTERMRIDTNGDVEIMQGKKIVFVFAGGSTHRATISGQSDDDLEFTTGSSDTLAARFKGNQRIQFPEVYSTAGSSMRDVQIESDGTLAGLSSITAAKTNITDLTDVSWIYNLKPKTFNFRKKTVHAVTGVNTYLDEAEDEKAHGFLAEDVEAINKDFCFYNKDSEGNDVLAGVYYKTMIVPLVKAVQELKAENTALATRVAALEAV